MAEPAFSVVILTLDEERTLPHCLDSLGGLDDVVVFDSYSGDRTVEIARAWGARLVQRRFDNYAAQRNAALSEVQYRHPWVLMLDADECLTAELRAEMEQRLPAADPATSLFRFRRRDHFGGRWIRHSSGYPTWFGRVIRLGRVEVAREVNEEYLTDGRVEHLRHHLDHYPFRNGLHRWFARHNDYSTREAALMRAGRQQWRVRELFARDPSVRRRAVKALVYRFPLRPVLVFLALYVVRRGFLDGRPGFDFAVMRAMYEAMIDLKVRHGRDDGLSETAPAMPPADEPSIQSTPTASLSKAPRG